MTAHRPSHEAYRLVNLGTTPSASDLATPMVDPSYDPEKGVMGLPPRREVTETPQMGGSQSSSLENLAGVKKRGRGYVQFESGLAGEPELAFARGDATDSKASGFLGWLLDVSIVSRWFVLTISTLGILWIPGILGLTKFPDATIWGVKLIWWSIWLSVAWTTWWASLLVARILPTLGKATVGSVVVSTRRYIDWLGPLQSYVAFFAWTLALWVSYVPLIIRMRESNADARSQDATDLIGRLLFAVYLCALLLLFEKFSIQWIAIKFHEKSYAERIADQKFAVRSLVTLYRNSRNIGRPDTLGAAAAASPASQSTSKLFKAALKGVRTAATHTTTVFGIAASEMAGSPMLQPNSPQAVVRSALESANKSRLLARRLFYSFAKPGSDYLDIDDISPLFPTREEAEAVFALLDKDQNGDVTRDDVEMALMEFHREQLSIERSMQDLDSAVGRLDNILMSLYVVIAALIIAVALQAQLLTLVTGAGTLILGLSWLIGGSLQEVLTSIIFLFVKHPFDVGDRVNIEKDKFVVKEIRLLSTVLLDLNGMMVQAPNVVLNGKFIQNIRRSPQMSESFDFDVAYSTTFEQLEELRAKMLEWVKKESRDYQPAFDVVVVDFPGQEKLSLKADIKYKSNFQQGAMKAKRRNKWICTLKTILADLKIFGPSGDPGAVPEPTRYTLVPWDDVQEEDRRKGLFAREKVGEGVPPGGWKLSDKNAVIVEDAGDVYGEVDQLHMAQPRRGVADETRTPTSQPPPGRPIAPTVGAGASTVVPPLGTGPATKV